MAGAIEGVIHTNSDTGSSQSVTDRQKFESAFGSVLASVAMQAMERNMSNLREAIAETEEDT